MEKDAIRSGKLYRKASFAIDGDFFRKCKDGSRPMWTRYELAEPLLKKGALFGVDFALGKCYDLNGCLGVDKERCCRYLRAPQKGDMEAMFCLSRTYSMAWFEESEPEPVLEKKYLVQAAERGHHEALHRLVAGSDNDAERGKWLKLLVEHCKDEELCSSGLVYELAVRHEHGVGVPHNDDLAIKWHAKAAELGYTNSLLALVRCCEEDRGVEQDEAKALELYHMAAKRGSSEAMFTLGKYSENGEDMRKSPKNAARWYE